MTGLIQRLRAINTISVTPQGAEIQSNETYYALRTHSGDRATQQTKQYQRLS